MYLIITIPDPPFPPCNGAGVSSPPPPPPPLLVSPSIFVLDATEYKIPFPPPPVPPHPPVVEGGLGEYLVDPPPPAYATGLALIDVVAPAPPLAASVGTGLP